VHESEHQYNHHKFNSKYRFLPQKAHPSFAKEPPIFVLAKEPPFPLQRASLSSEKSPPLFCKRGPRKKEKNPTDLKEKMSFYS